MDCWNVRKERMRDRDFVGGSVSERHGRSAKPLAAANAFPNCDPGRRHLPTASAQGLSLGRLHPSSLFDALPCPPSKPSRNTPTHLDSQHTQWKGITLPRKHYVPSRLEPPTTGLPPPAQHPPRQRPGTSLLCSGTTGTCKLRTRRVES